MICINCKRKITIADSLLLDHNGTAKRSDFCCYDCYKAFWKGCKGFKLLKQAKGGRDEHKSGRKC